MNKKPQFSRNTLTFLCCLLAMPTATYLIPGIAADTIETAILAGAVLGGCYLLVRPILRVLTLPIGCLTLGLTNLLIDVALIEALPKVFPGFTVSGFQAALLSALLVNGVCMITGGFR